MRNLKSDFNKLLLTLNVITLSDFHCHYFWDFNKGLITLTLITLNSFHCPYFWDCGKPPLQQPPEDDQSRGSSQTLSNLLDDVILQDVR